MLLHKFQPDPTLHLLLKAEESDQDQRCKSCEKYIAVLGACHLKSVESLLKLEPV
jgi:hypothetical protein